jgi:hypothetical protein
MLPDPPTKVTTHQVADEFTEDRAEVPKTWRLKIAPPVLYFRRGTLDENISALSQRRICHHGQTFSGQ